MKGKAGVQNSNNAYMLVYMLRDTLKEVRLLEAEEKRKRETLVKASRIPEALDKKFSNEGEPEEKKRKVRSTFQNIFDQIGFNVEQDENDGQKREKRERRERCKILGEEVKEKRVKRMKLDPLKSFC